MWRKDQGERANQEYTNFVSRLKNRKDHPINKAIFEQQLTAIESLKASNLAYKVAFQRALILAFLEFVTIDGTDLPDFEGDDENGDSNDSDETKEVQDKYESAPTGGAGALCLKRAKQFVKGLNVLVEAAPEFLDVKGAFDSSFIWQGSLYNRVDDAIDFTLGASNRASHLVFIAAALALCKQQGDEAIEGGFDAFWGTVSESDIGIHKKFVEDC